MYFLPFSDIQIHTKWMQSAHLSGDKVRWFVDSALIKLEHQIATMGRNWITNDKMSISICVHNRSSRPPNASGRNLIIGGCQRAANMHCAVSVKHSVAYWRMVVGGKGVSVILAVSWKIVLICLSGHFISITVVYDGDRRLLLFLCGYLQLINLIWLQLIVRVVFQISDIGRWISFDEF